METTVYQRKNPGYIILMVTTIICTLAAVSTVIPSPLASKACMLGYKAHCTFTPIGTIMCLAFAGISCVVRARFFTTKHKKR
jgi:hypothetical protein